MKKIFITALILAGVQAQAEGDLRIFVNNQGCSVIEQIEATKRIVDIQKGSERELIVINSDGTMDGDLQMIEDAGGIRAVSANQGRLQCADLEEDIGP
nr:hypothetical protein CKG001_04480 [Bdellovibrio sp. CKG001]BFD61770.1 hypothetical protein BdHM001_04510 [Bdellovibrio sp. HM001]BFD65596.1 hypothetical protein HAGR004_06180 [Bdellovibrio sp. HAGR004]